MVMLFVNNDASAVNTVAATASPTEGLSQGSKLLAERYKTRTCKTFMAQGHCPYYHRCMFAHGVEDMRTVAQNVADGLITEQAIKAYQQQRRRASYVPSVEVSVVHSDPTGFVSVGDASSQASSATLSSDSMSQVSGLFAASDVASLMPTEVSPPTKARFSHNPYYNAIGSYE